MKISDVRIRLIDQEAGKLKAVASLVIDDCFVVHDIKIVDGEGGAFIAMPSRKTPDGNYKDIVHPINTQTRELFKEAVLEAYEKALAEQSV
ncbi:MAG TPA: hypothetical protein DEF02_03410 [Clostridiales bacterium]|mgnify:FL=1|nr:hypothetical protein [Clostridiales bacterium]